MKRQKEIARVLKGEERRGELGKVGKGTEGFTERSNVGRRNDGKGCDVKNGRCGAERGGGGGRGPQLLVLVLLNYQNIYATV